MNISAAGVHAGGKARVGLIGLGAMGRGAAQSLMRSGIEVVGFDVQAAALSWLEEQGGVRVDSVAELAAQVDTVVSFVINSSQTESVLFGDGGLVGKLRAGATFIACSTMEPAYVEALAVRLARDSIRFLDAPVTGGPEGAKNGSLTIMGSGESQTFHDAKPVLSAMGARVFHLGPAGAGTKMKIVNQLLVGANLVAASEAVALARHLSLPLETTLEILSSGAASSWMLENRGPRMAAGAFDEVAGAVDILLKDLSLVLDATRGARFPAPVAHSAYLAFADASARGLGAKDCAAITTNYQRYATTPKP